MLMLKLPFAIQSILDGVGSMNTGILSQQQKLPVHTRLIRMYIKIVVYTMTLVVAGLSWKN